MELAGEPEAPLSPNMSDLSAALCLVPLVPLRAPMLTMRLMALPLVLVMRVVGLLPVRLYSRSCRYSSENRGLSPSGAAEGKGRTLESVEVWMILCACR